MADGGRRMALGQVVRPRSIRCCVAASSPHAQAFESQQSRRGAVRMGSHAETVRKRWRAVTDSQPWPWPWPLFFFSAGNWHSSARGPRTSRRVAQTIRKRRGRHGPGREWASQG